MGVCLSPKFARALDALEGEDGHRAHHLVDSPPQYPRSGMDPATLSVLQRKWQALPLRPT